MCKTKEGRPGHIDLKQDPKLQVESGLGKGQALQRKSSKWLLNWSVVWNWDAKKQKVMLRQDIWHYILG